jgi:YidC/Oxa1 family membrane protein insertase
MDQRRVLLAFLLMAVVLIGSQWWYARMESSTPEGAPADTSKVVAPAPSGNGAVPAGADLPQELTGAADTTALTAPGTSAPPPDPYANALLEGGPPPAEVVIETPRYRLTIDPRGGVIRQAELLRYESYQRPGPVHLVPPGAAFLERTADVGDRRIALDSLMFRPSARSLSLQPGDSARTLTLAFESGSGRIEQAYRFDPEGYVVEYRLQLDPSAEGILVTALGPRLQSNEKNPREDYDQLRAVARVDDQIVSVQPDDAQESPVALGGEVDWAGLKDKYFMATLLAPADGALSAIEVRGASQDSLPVMRVSVASPIRAGASGYRVYLGPQEYRQLSALGEGLDDINQYGWSWIRWMITPFAKAIVVSMLWLYRFIPDWGVVLIVFGVLVRLAMWPLTTKSFRSIQAMQKIQPEIQRLRERFKEDPQRMQQETMKLYKEKKVNPLGGCLPNLIPMPILFALFFVFQSTIEFRGQPFLWLPDLSQSDPWYILPVLMGLTMFVSSKMTQSDPKMAAMTYVMPVVLTFVFINLAAGLVLYYTVSNVLTFVQQWMLRRTAEGPLEARPAEG